MKKWIIPILILLLTASVPSQAKKKGGVPVPFELTSPAFKPQGPIPPKHSCAGADLSPALGWNEPPQGTKTFALVMDDPDAPAGTWVHWVVYDIPASSRGLAEALPREENLKDGTRQGRAYGVETFSRTGYSGPCPPSGTHHYVFKLFALDTALALAPKATVFDLDKAMKAHVLAKAELVGTFKRSNP